MTDHAPAPRPVPESVTDWLARFDDLARWSAQLDQTADEREAEGITADWARYDEERADLNELLAALTVEAAALIRGITGLRVQP